MARGPRLAMRSRVLAAALAAGLLAAGCATGPQALVPDKLAACHQRLTRLPAEIEGFMVVSRSTDPTTGETDLELWDPDEPGRPIDRGTRRRLRQAVSPCPLAEVESTTRPPHSSGSTPSASSIPPAASTG